MELALSEIDHSVWTQIEQRGATADEAFRTAWAPHLRAMAAEGLTTAQQAAMVTVMRPLLSALCERGLEAFEALGRAIDHADRASRVPISPPEIASFMIEIKVVMAKVFDGMARVAPVAGVSGLPPAAETARLVSEAEAERERFARLHARGT